VKLFWLPEESRNGTKPASSFTRRCLHLQVLLETMLPPATPTLGSLVKLGLIGLHLVDLPREVLECLKQLKHFDVSLNEFTRLPVGLKEIPSLEFLNLAGNSKLQFRSSDADLLAAFPGLQVLRLGAQFYPDVAVNEFGSQPVVRWTQASAGAFVAIAKKLPELDLRFAKDLHALDICWDLWP
jgi:hypothetical protein